MDKGGKERKKKKKKRKKENEQDESFVPDTVSLSRKGRGLLFYLTKSDSAVWIQIWYRHFTFFQF